MAVIVTRAGKGSPLTNTEVDANFTNLNTAKVETITSADNSVIVSVPSSGTVDLSVAVAGATTNLIAQVRNQSGSTITKGSLIYISGASGNKALITLAQANSEATSAGTFGMVNADILNNQNGYVNIAGSISGLNTSAYADGTKLYLSPTVAGGWTSTKPSAPSHLVYVGVVIYSHATQGVIQLRIQNGYEIEELHNVAISTPADQQVLVYQASTGLWINQAIPASGDPAGTAVAMAIALG